MSADFDAPTIGALNNLPGFPNPGSFEFGNYLSNLSIRPAAAFAAALPTSGNVAGEVRYAVAENAWYTWNGAAWVVVGGTGGPATEIQESGGPTTLSIGVIADGETLVRQGASVVGQVPVASSFIDSQLQSGQVGALTPTYNVFVEGSSGLLSNPNFTGGVGASLYDLAEGWMEVRESGTTLGSDAGFAGAGVVAPPQALPDYLTKFRVDDTLGAVSNVRVFCGLSTAGTLNAMVNSDAPAGSYVGIQYSTNRPDTNWQWVSSDGITQNVVDTGRAFALNDTLIVRLRWGALASVVCTLMSPDLTMLDTHTFTTNLPASGDTLNYIGGLENRDGGPTAAQFGWFYAYLAISGRG